MSDSVTMAVPLPPDEHGMIGRLCPACAQNFKLKPGTGLPTSDCHCPYCEHLADSSEFATPEQLEYAKSIAVKKMVEPILRDFERSLRDLERFTRGSFIQVKVHTSGTYFPVQYYTERALETTVVCDSCGLVFAIYGVFASCPDCARLSTMSLFKNSLNAARRRLDILPRALLDHPDIAEVILVDALSAAVASFDALGKRLATEFPSLIPSQPRSLFQNLDALNTVTSKSISTPLDTLLPPGEYRRLYYLFQVRHISSHNFGEIDDDFVRKTGESPSLKGTKPEVSRDDVMKLVSLIEVLGTGLREKLKDCA